MLTGSVPVMLCALLSTGYQVGTCGLVLLKGDWFVFLPLYVVCLSYNSVRSKLYKLKCTEMILVVI